MKQQRQRETMEGLTLPREKNAITWSVCSRYSSLLQQALQCSQGGQLLGLCVSGEVFLWKQFQDVFKVNFDRS